MSKIERTSLPLANWPDQDSRLWQASNEAGRYFQQVGKAAHWSEATKLQVQKGYAKWLWYLQQMSAAGITQVTYCRNPDGVAVQTQRSQTAA